MGHVRGKSGSCKGQEWVMWGSEGTRRGSGRGCVRGQRGSYEGPEGHVRVQSGGEGPEGVRDRGVM